MLRVPFTLDLFRRATESARRLVMFIIFEGVFVAIGVVLAVFILPMARATVEDSNLELSPIFEAAFTGYWIIIAALAAHAILSGPVMPRLSKRMLAIWTALGAILPALIVLVPAIAIGAAYGALLGDLQS